MKSKFVAAILSAVSVISLGVLAACGDGGENGGAPQTYSIQAPGVSELYTVTGLSANANEGETVNFDVESESVFYTVDTVTVNGAAITPDIFGYSFTMPAEDVEIEVVMSPVGEYDDPDDHLSWGSSVTGKIPSSGSDDFQIPLYFDGISSGNWITDIDATIYSSDEEVIPSTAIEFVPVRASASTAIIGGYLAVDLSGVGEGETFIYLELDPNNSSLGTLIKEFSVVPEEQIEAETMEVVFTYKNNTDYADENIFFNIADTAGGDILTFYSSDFVGGKLTFDYAVGHTYRVTCAYAVYNEETGRYENMTNLYLNEWEGEGAVTGGHSANSLDRESGYPYRNILDLSTEGVEVPLIIVDSI